MLETEGHFNYFHLFNCSNMVEFYFQTLAPDFSCFKYFKNLVAPRLELIEIILPAFKYVNVSTISSSVYLKEHRPGVKYTLKGPL